MGKIKSTASSGTASSDGKFCEVAISNGQSTFSDCIKFSKHRQELADAALSNANDGGNMKLVPSNYLSTVQLGGLTGDGQSSAFTSGKANFRLNNWLGTMEYLGSESDPKWVAHSGDQEKSGTFTGKVVRPAPKDAIELMFNGLRTAPTSF